MSLNVKLLSLLLVLQLGVSFYLFSNEDKLSDFKPNSEFIDFAKKDLNKITLTKAESEKDQRNLTEVSLLKEDKLWKVKIKENFNFKANQIKVKELISNLKAIKKPLPTSTNKSSHSKLKVKRNNFEKKIILNTKDKIKEFLIGADSGFKEVYIRDKEDANSYSVKFDTSNLSFEPLKWIDTDFLKLKFSKIAELKLDNLNLIKEENKFKLKEEKDLKLNQEKVNSIIKAIANLSIESVILKDKTKLVAPVKSLVLTLDGVKITYNFYENNDKNYNLSLSNQENIFTVLKAPIDKIFEFKKDDLLEKKEIKKEAKILKEEKDDKIIN